ncbi:MAG: phosphonate metabolism protein/1,5-bisphosphokinase (PRPP-forming) PhnN [Hyphomicrobiales bacterium]|nr:phosphonate metabolism protein/1,5-bisphosphokinase (PRPP-forming) PhnN [Hyphomicrobiales bacterium]
MSDATSISRPPSLAETSVRVRDIVASVRTTPSARGTGVFVLVAGPSGAGKDTLLRIARDWIGHMPKLHFVRRQVTRQANPSIEDHDTLSAQEFTDGVRRGAFSFFWSANGLWYGVPAVTETWFGAGDVIVVNVSRTVVPAIVEKYRRVVVVLVTAPQDILAERLAARGRENGVCLDSRLERAGLAVPEVPASYVIENTGAPQDGAGKLSDLLASLCRR